MRGRSGGIASRVESVVLDNEFDIASVSSVTFAIARPTARLSTTSVAITHAPVTLLSRICFPLVVCWGPTRYSCGLAVITSFGITGSETFLPIFFTFYSL